MNLRLLLYLQFLLIHITLFSQTSYITGTVSDDISGEPMAGATIIIQGTYTGTITDLEGKYFLRNVSPGRYNLVVSYVSYSNQIVTVEVTRDNPAIADVTLKLTSVAVDEVTFVGRRKVDTESAVIATVKSSGIIANGISADQIRRSQDSNAAEVIRRVPGITISDGRFAIVRGLSERYTHVMLNRAPAPSFEADKKSFSFDAIPSGMIQNIMIYKSPAPELSGDFSGSVIDIMTKEVADKNSFRINYSSGYVSNTSFNGDFLTYHGGKYDFLGFDDGTRALPKELPTLSEMKELYVWPDINTYFIRMDSLQIISRAFNNHWSTKSVKPFLDQNLSSVVERRFLLGNVSLGNITVLNYKFSNNYNEIIRKEYYGYDLLSDKEEIAYDYKDITSKKEADLGVIHNWILIFGNNQRLGLRNLFNNTGISTTTLRKGEDSYNTLERVNTNLRYQQRLVYSTQLDGNHLINNNLTSIKWLVGYTFISNNDPDNRRYSYVRPLNSNDSIPFEFVVDTSPSVYYGGRLSQKLNEENKTIRLDLVHDIYYSISHTPIEIKTGFYYDKKDRDFNTRLIGIVAPRGTGQNRLQIGDRTRPVEELLAEENFYYNPNSANITGLMYRDGSASHNSYIASDKILAGYAGMNLPVAEFLEIYGGFRTESFDRLITGFYDKRLLGDTADIKIDTVNIFPSLNLKFKLGTNYNIRFSYGKTTNRPEFRENSPIIYEDFDEIAIVMGNEDLKPAYIHNFDARIEWYPDYGEMISLAAFYKDFTDPVEIFQIPAGTGWNYKPFNTEKAVSKGLEFDVRKSLHFLNQMPLSGFTKHLTVLLNVTLIKSEINTAKDFAREPVRMMQGQSPFIINLGSFYNNPKNGLMVNKL